MFNGLIQRRDRLLPVSIAVVLDIVCYSNVHLVSWLIFVLSFFSAFPMSFSALTVIQEVNKCANFDKSYRLFICLDCVCVCV